MGLKHNPMQHVKRKRQEKKLHKPFNNIKGLLEDIKNFNTNLYLCCLLNYGCLLRPHREIRELKWGDFSDDLSFINLIEIPVSKDWLITQKWHSIVNMRYAINCFSGQ